jgi:hypothetical protein
VSSPDPNGGDTATFTYRSFHKDGRYYAEAQEAEAMGEGDTHDEAVESLRAELTERLLSPDAVAPPAKPARHRVVLVEVSRSIE